MNDKYDIFFSMRNERSDIRGLYEMINYINYSFDTSEASMVELGSYAGQSTCIFGQYFKKVHAVDPWENHNEYSHNMKDVEEAFDFFAGKQSGIIKHKEYSVDAAKEFDDSSLDLVYIDARHEEEYVIQDIEAWLPKVKKSGFIGGHDFYLHSAKEPWVAKAVLQKFNQPDLLLFKDGSWLTKASKIPEERFLYKAFNQFEMERVLDGRFPPMNFYLEGVTEEERERVKNRGYETFQPLK